MSEEHWQGRPAYNKQQLREHSWKLKGWLDQRGGSWLLAPDHHSLQQTRQTRASGLTAGSTGRHAREQTPYSLRKCYLDCSHQSGLSFARKVALVLELGLQRYRQTL